MYHSKYYHNFSKHQGWFYVSQTLHLSNWWMTWKMSSANVILPRRRLVFFVLKIDWNIFFKFTFVDIFTLQMWMCWVRHEITDHFMYSKWHCYLLGWSVCLYVIYGILLRWAGFSLGPHLYYFVQFYTRRIRRSTNLHTFS